MSYLRAVPSDSDLPSRSGSAASVRVEAPGKVNLFLSAGAPGADGYHPLTTVFQAVRLIETVTARRQAADAIGAITLTLEEPDPAVPTGEDNLAVAAARLLATATGVTEGVDLLVRKRVPVAGGMAGGSADAAGTLLACNQLWGTGLALDHLMSLARHLGADVPFPLLGGSALGTDRGDELSPLMTRGTYHWVLALQDRGLPTPSVFRRLDELRGPGAVPEAPALPEAPTSTRDVPPASGLTPQPDARTRASAPDPVPPALTAALRAGDAHALAQVMRNDLEAAALDLRPELADVIDVAQASGALRAMVSGSGPTVAALVTDMATAQRVSRALTASGVCSGVLRVDAPVAGARVVG
ncbi:4-(cytidine 5'-diphospho)-2-C-methyl-D-erythritol kinase [uncultured Actinomyces sp.]|uniref:4-(cytidine 5'-diphospho)-2-C-methyl-D-erythritol kinase n=1 Tax=uncultured Actinomyces sp. TaxID=249061 RepID=UPI002603BAD8|nr:4-(cytidine 5'-diphospho)-2-C-methyl-D-erythritol kinase [uncultured Actinomyces sp.]